MDSNEIADKARRSKIPTGKGKVIYIAGPYRNKTEEGKRDNIWHAIRMACRLAELNWYPICPHANTANFEIYTDLPDKYWLDMGLELLSRSDAVMMLNGFEASEGSRAEYDLAVELGKDIYFE